MSGEYEGAKDPRMETHGQPPLPRSLRDLAAAATQGEDPRERLEAQWTMQAALDPQTVLALLDVVEAAREALTEWDTHGTEALCWVVQTRLRAALDALPEDVE